MVTQCTCGHVRTDHMHIDDDEGEHTYDCTLCDCKQYKES